jgi:hypothetical protein
MWIYETKKNKPAKCGVSKDVAMLSGDEGQQGLSESQEQGARRRLLYKFGLHLRFVPRGNLELH